MRVDYAIIGAGTAGTVLRKMLASDSVVLLDPKPGAYKIGESIIPEHFIHPVMRELLPGVRKLPSYSPKWGTTFVSEDAVASFPLPPHVADLSMHVSREELDSFMHETWRSPIVRSRVREIDLVNKRLVTDEEIYDVDRQIIDCSGGAMVVAHALDEVSEVWPVWARWMYFDIEDIDSDRYWRAIEEGGMSYLRYDAPHARLLEADEDGWRPELTTTLTRIRDGEWTWQIPLFHHSRLSFGVVSRHGPVTTEAVLDLAERTKSAQYTLRPRELDGSSSYNRVHQRNHFARRARRAASMDHILVADAFGFADPVYSVGTGLAVNKAIEVAAALNDGGWTEEKCEAYCTGSEKVLASAIEAYGLWYDGDVLRSDASATNVQEGFLVGNAFQVAVTTHYGRVLMATKPADADEKGPLEGLLFGPDGAVSSVAPRVSQLLGLGPKRALAEWTLADALPLSRGIQMRWERPGVPDLRVNAVHDPGATRYFRRVADVTLSFENLMGEPYPIDGAGFALFDALEAHLRAQTEAWTGLLVGTPDESPS